MRWTRWTAGVAVAAVAAAIAHVTSCAPSRPAGMTLEQRIARGRELVTIAGCGDCHTPGTLYNAPDTTRRLSGSEIGWRGPWGTSYARNLTPHETGLAAWSEADIVRALRQGQRPDGSPLLPPMPWPNYSSMKDEDAYAIAAYLKSLAPVDHAVPDRLAPGAPAIGPEIVFPAPPTWDVPPRDTTAAMAL
jgi:mono/diheme cytochrome c family protein